MGLILATLSAGSSVLKDQWKEYFYCEALERNTICVKAQKKTKGLFNKGNDNVISDGSVIAVADGQCMLIVDQGQVVDFCAEPGEYKFDSASAPSLFTGNLGDSLKQVFNEVGKRITFGGGAAQDTRVYYFNTKELIGLKYGTASPVPFRVVDQRAGIDIDISLKAFGEYSIHVCDPLLFYTNVCGNVADRYLVTDLENQMRSELLTALQPAFAKISAMGIRYSEVVGHTTELANALNEELSAKWRQQRGIEIVSFGVSSLKANADDEAMLKEMQKNAAYTNPNLAAATLVGAQAQAMKDAANNSAGAMNGFFGMNAAMNAGGVNAQNLYAMGAQQNTQPVSAQWTCPKCGTVTEGNFCPQCGTPKNAKWICPQCGKENEGNFCAQCGTKKPA